MGDVHPAAPSPAGERRGCDAVPARRDRLRRHAEHGRGRVPQIAALTAPPWHYLELETGHWPMFSVPDALAEMLDGLVAGR